MANTIMPVAVESVTPIITNSPTARRGDGNLDLHLAAHGMEAIAAWNDGKGHFTQIECPIEAKYGKGKTQPVAVPGGEIRGAFDLDEDGKLDLLMSYHDGGGVVAMNDCKPAPGGGAPPVWNFKPYQPGFDSYSRPLSLPKCACILRPRRSTAQRK